MLLILLICLFLETRLSYILFSLAINCICWLDEAETFGELNLGKQYFEGDIILTEEQSYIVQNLWQDDKVASRDLPKGFRKIWPNNTLPYTIASGMRKYSCKIEQSNPFISKSQSRVSHTLRYPSWNDTSFKIITRYFWAGMRGCQIKEQEGLGSITREK